MKIKEINNYTIKTIEGWNSFKGIKKSIIPYHFIISFNDDTQIKGSENHQIQLINGDFFEISLLLEGDQLLGGKIVTKIECIEEELEVYDILHINNESNSYISEGISHHNCAFIDGVQEIWTSAQSTLSTGGKCIALSTPYGTGNFFHKTWVAAEEGENGWIPIRLPWHVHPERDQKWRDKQDIELGPKEAAQECDTEFSTSGDTVFPNDWIQHALESTCQDPINYRGIDNNFWIWEYVDYAKDYVVLADVARGDGADYSTFHIMDIKSNIQVAEYKGQMSTKEFGYFLVSVATEYNNALLVVENNNIGWSVIEAILERGYRNLYYSDGNETKNPEERNQFDDLKQNTPGFNMNLRTRPLCINKLREYIGDKSITIRSKRFISEAKVFIWKNGRAEAQSGYNDDLIMPMALGMFIRDTALKFQKNNLDMIRATLSSIKSNQSYQTPMISGQHGFVQNPYKMEINGESHDIKWLL